MTQEERTTAVADVLAELNERREDKKTSIPHANTAAFNDVRATLAKIQQEVRVTAPMLPYSH